MFIGPYLTTAAERDEFCHNYLLLTEGFLSFPLALPGTGLWRAMKARHKVLVGVGVGGEGVGGYTIHETQHFYMHIIALYIPQIVDVLLNAARQSKARMASGAAPECLLDFWSQRINEELAEAKKSGKRDVCVCMYVCVCVCMRVCMCVCVCVCMRVRALTYELRH